MVSWFVVKRNLGSIFILLDNRPNNAGGASVIQVNPWLLRPLIPLSLLQPEEFDLLFGIRLDGKLILVLVAFEPLTLQKLLNVFKRSAD